MLAMITALMTSAVIPWSTSLHLFGRDIPLQIADINIGILYVFGVVSMGVYGIMIGGWASNNKFSLLAAIRGASQMISYELPMGLSLIAVLMMVGDLQNERDCQQPDWKMAGISFTSPWVSYIFCLCACRM